VLKNKQTVYYVFSVFKCHTKLETNKYFVFVLKHPEDMSVVSMMINGDFLSTKYEPSTSTLYKGVVNIARDISI